MTTGRKQPTPCPPEPQARRDERCQARNDNTGGQCGRVKGHDADHTTLIESQFLKRQTWTEHATPEASEPTPDASTVERLANLLEHQDVQPDDGKDCHHGNDGYHVCLRCCAEYLVTHGVGFVADARRKALDDAATALALKCAISTRQNRLAESMTFQEAEETIRALSDPETPPEGPK